jgi:hypothetical protein
VSIDITSNPWRNQRPNINSTVLVDILRLGDLPIRFCRPYIHYPDYGEAATKVSYIQSNNCLTVATTDFTKTNSYTTRSYTTPTNVHPVPTVIDSIISTIYSPTVDAVVDNTTSTTNPVTSFVTVTVADIRTQPISTTVTKHCQPSLQTRQRRCPQNPRRNQGLCRQQDLQCMQQSGLPGASY